MSQKTRILFAKLAKEYEAEVLRPQRLSLADHPVYDHEFVVLPEYQTIVAYHKTRHYLSVLPLSEVVKENSEQFLREQIINAPFYKLEARGSGIVISSYLHRYLPLPHPVFELMNKMNVLVREIWETASLTQ